MLLRCLLLVLLSLKAGWAQTPWRHYNLDIRLTVPKGWRVTQGPVVVDISPRARFQGERKPKFGLTWQQAPPTLLSAR